MNAVDPAAQHAIAATATVSGVATWWATATEVASALFGVPLQVVLAAVTGAFAARSFQIGTTYIKSLGGGIIWAVIGIFCCQIAIWLMTRVIGEPPPMGAAAGAALIVSAGGQMLITPKLIEKVKRAVARYVDGLWRNK